MTNKFNVEDWVEITPNPDHSWTEWTSIHDDFCGAIGKITKIEPDPLGNEDNDKIKVAVDFKEYKYDKIHTHYWMWFLKRHVIISSKSKSETRQNLRKQGSDLQQWEVIKKRILDNNLGSLFTPQAYRKEKSIASEEADPWNEKTDPLIPLPGTLSRDDNGVILIPDDVDLDESDWDDLFDI